MFDPVKETKVVSQEEDDAGTTKINQYSIVKYLGKGAYGTVYLARDDTTGLQYAVKEFSKSRMRKAMWAMSSRSRLGAMRGGRGGGRGGALSPRGGSSMRSTGSGSGSGSLSVTDDDNSIIAREVAILKKLHHPHCVKLYEVIEVEAGDQIYMIFELCSGGPIMNLDEQGCSTAEALSAERARDYFQQLVLGIEYLHAHHIVHRDLKPDNLLLSADNELKIVDFGVSELFSSLSDSVSQSAGSPAFVAPELCNVPSSPHPIIAATDSGRSSSMGGSGMSTSGRATDVWSMGVCLYCMIFGRLPFRGASVVELYRAICNAQPDWHPPKSMSAGSWIRESPDAEPTLDPYLYDLLYRMLDKNPATRITLDEVRDHPWVTDHDDYILPTKSENVAVIISPDDITASELSSAVSKIKATWSVIKFAAKLRHRASASSLASSRRSSVAASEGSLNQDPTADSANHLAHASDSQLNASDPKPSCPPQHISTREPKPAPQNSRSTSSSLSSYSLGDLTKDKTQTAPPTSTVSHAPPPTSPPLAARPLYRNPTPPPKSPPVVPQTLSPVQVAASPARPNATIPVLDLDGNSTPVVKPSISQQVPLPNSPFLPLHHGMELPQPPAQQLPPGARNQTLAVSQSDSSLVYHPPSNSPGAHFQTGHANPPLSTSISTGQSDPTLTGSFHSAHAGSSSINSKKSGGSFFSKWTRKLKSWGESSKEKEIRK
ncbi:kinase-like domain-containing protein [Catenaria anguillulae PL171]|uniref:Kinase-like domain-containing protein n=1 Tax=Catenaria anguillulae PL171 TaxID=765915 RepID=A0A1Y2H4S8_9FUNG|nr:kinase-like domain-containing protein [Catenaria anguillulae PL171]